MRWMFLSGIWILDLYGVIWGFVWGRKYFLGFYVFVLYLLIDFN